MTGTSTEETSKATSSVTDQVIQALLQCLSNATYACGGTIKATHLKDSDATVSAAKAVTGDQVLAHPITIRWDSAASIEKLTLPLSNGVVAEENDPIMKLVADTQPASFGFQGKDVIDESYRKASKLDTTAFSTNFCPYESGIIDVIGQTLLPKHPSSSQGIRAELYKLNVSSRLRYDDKIPLSTKNRSTKLLPDSSERMLIRRAPSYSLDHSWYACRVSMKEASSLCVTKARQ
jgi:hypothetical protein